MHYIMDLPAEARMESYFLSIGEHLKDRRKRASYAMYAHGILGEGARKSAEPIAARACGDPAETKRTQDKLLHFLGRAEWSDSAVRLVAARYVVEALAEREPVTTWIVDDTGFLKQGKHSVGVQRQYTGSAGKVTNCQIGVSLSVATDTAHAPIDFELYLPESWTDDAGRREAVRIPDDVQFKTKPELALDMIRRAREAAIPGEIVLADSAYGDSSDFRSEIRALGLDYAVGIKRTTKVYRVNKKQRAFGKPQAVDELAMNDRKAFRRITWREGTKCDLSSRFAFFRVKPMHDDGSPLRDREPLWLVAEWPEGEASPTKFVLTTLPRRMTHAAIVRIFKERWRTEQMYRDLKNELGLDHFEGRSYPGWHHHVSVVLSCAAFVVAEQVRAFPPSGSRNSDSSSVQRAA